MNNKPTCPKCGASEVVKNGKARGKQRFKCKNCNFQFTILVPRGYPPETKARVIDLYNHGLSIRVTLSFKTSLVLLLLTGSGSSQKKIYEKPAPGEAILVELDEMWHYLGSRKNKLWIWKAYRRETGELIDWECGNRDKATLTKLVERLSSWKVELYCADNWAKIS